MATSTNKSILQLNTSISSSPVWITKIEGKEGFSQLFNYKLRIATQQSIPLSYSLIGKLISFSINATEDQDGRDFNGLLINFTYIGEDSITGWYYYEMELVPWAWLLTQRSNCKIFPGNNQRNEVTVKQVLEELFNDYPTFKVDLSGIKDASITSDFWLQYNETDFNFLSRLTETYGIYYYFSQSKDTHTLILADQKQSYSTKSHQAYRFFSSGSQQAQINSWKHIYKFVPKTWTLNSHNIEQPSTKLQAKSDSCINHQRSGPTEFYQYTNNYQQCDQGSTLAKTRIEADEAHSNVVEASSNIISLGISEHLQLDDKYFPQETEKDFIITELAFYAEDANLPGKQDNASSYTNVFCCTPASQTFRPLPTARQLHGNQLHEAIVTGAANEEIHTDDLHRIRVQFIWDRIGENDANSSCWIRCVSPWEGLLRVGTPVLVGFLNNNANIPIVLGPLYDTQQKPLFTEPTMSGLKRRHGTNGDDTYYNELRFNDKKDQAEVYLHACKDMNVAIDNNLTTTIKNNEVMTIDQSRTVDIKQGNDSLTLDQGNITIKVSQGTYEITVQGNVTIKSSADITIQATQNMTLSAQQISIEASSTLNLKGATTNINGSSSVAVKGGTIQLN